MTIERANLDEITESDIGDLVNAQIPEGLRLDYKRSTYGSSDKDKRELLKDVSAFANSHGGHLILGMAEQNGVAAGVPGIGSPDPDAEILRMEQIIRSGLEPPVPSVHMKAIPLNSGKYVILIRVPRSWYPPHRVIAQNVNRLYIRHSAGVHEPSVEELRTLFNQSSTALEQARTFRDDRLKFIHEGRGEYPLEANGRLILHIVPIAAFSGMVNLDVEFIYTQVQVFNPIGRVPGHPRYNYYGVSFDRATNENKGYTQIFRNGILEATSASIIHNANGSQTIGAGALEGSIFNSLPKYLDGLRSIGVPQPLIIMFTLDGVRGVSYRVTNDIFFEEPSPLPEDILVLPEVVLEDYGTTAQYHSVVRPAFNALWNACGYPRSLFYNQEGVWTGIIT